MSSYNFRLQSLLRLRESERQQRRAELAEVYRAEEALRAQIGQLQQEQDHVAQAARAQRAGGAVNVDAVLNLDRYQLQVSLRTKAAEQQAAALGVESERRRQALVEADQQVRMLEKLRERGWQQHQFEEHRRENNILDEIAGRQFIRGGRASC